MDSNEYREKVIELAKECLSLARDEHQGADVLTEATSLAFELADDVVDMDARAVIEHSDNDNAIFASGHEDRLGEQGTVDGIIEELAFWAARADIIEQIENLHEGDGKEHHYRTKAGNLVIIEGDGRVTLDFSDTVRCFGGCKEASQHLQQWMNNESPGDQRRDYQEMLEVLSTFANENSHRVRM